MLSAAQKKAVCHGTGPCLVVASPGSGKTSVLVERIRYLIRECSVDPNEILVITFTRDAAIQMKKRFEQVEKDSFSPVFGTFHSIFFHILTIEKGYTSSSILYGEKKNFLLKKAFILNGINTEFFDEFYSEIDNKMTKVKLNLLHGDKISDTKIYNITRTYESLKSEMHYLDFSDMIFRALLMFKNEPEVLQRWQKRFSYILIDEAQDMNDLQFELIKLLSKEGEGVFAVGDEDQSIYGFRGANPGIFVDFKNIYPNSSVYMLEKNYRSTKGIVNVASNLISHNTVRFEKNMESYSDQDSIIEITQYKDAYIEAEEVAKAIQNQIESGVKPRDIAVLYRNNSISNLILSSLKKREVPVNIRRKPTGRESGIYNDFLLFLQVKKQPLLRKLIYRFLNLQSEDYYRSFFKTEVVDWNQVLSSTLIDEEKAFLLKLKGDIAFLQKLPPFLFVKYLRRTLKYDSTFEKMPQNLRDEAFSYINEIEEVAKHVESFNEFEEEIKERLKEETKTSDGVSMRTFHGAKGLEYKVVYIISACDGITPSNKAKSAGDIEEERRMFYVALTRAKKELYISFPLLIGEKQYGKSLFIDELQLSSIVSDEQKR